MLFLQGSVRFWKLNYRISLQPYANGGRQTFSDSEIWHVIAAQDCSPAGGLRAPAKRNVASLDCHESGEITLIGFVIHQYSP
jgi:hypothetical protein